MHEIECELENEEKFMSVENRDIDYKIIRLLQKNGRIPNTEIAKILGISEATVRKRLQNLIQDDRIQVIAIINPFKLKSGIMGNLRIRVEKKKLKRIGKELSELDELWYIAQLQGTTDYDAEYYVSSQSEFGRLMDKINKIEGIVSIETSLLVRYIKYAGGPAFPEELAG